jgi:antitoxin StbD
MSRKGFDFLQKTHNNALNYGYFIMTITQIIHAKTTVSMTDLRRNPSKILESAGDLPVAVLNHNKPEAYLLSAKAYEALLDLVDDLSMIKTIKARSGGKTVKVKLEDL